MCILELVRALLWAERWSFGLGELRENFHHSAILCVSRLYSLKVLAWALLSLRGIRVLFYAFENDFSPFFLLDKLANLQRSLLCLFTTTIFALKKETLKSARVYLSLALVEQFGLVAFFLLWGEKILTNLAFVSEFRIFSASQKGERRSSLL